MQPNTEAQPHLRADYTESLSADLKQLNEAHMNASTHVCAVPFTGAAFELRSCNRASLIIPNMNVLVPKKANVQMHTCTHVQIVECTLLRLTVQASIGVPLSDPEGDLANTGTPSMRDVCQLQRACLVLLPYSNRMPSHVKAGI